MFFTTAVYFLQSKELFGISNCSHFMCCSHTGNRLQEGRREPGTCWTCYDNLLVCQLVCCCCNRVTASLLLTCCCLFSQSSCCSFILLHSRKLMGEWNRSMDDAVSCVWVWLYHGHGLMVVVAGQKLEFSSGSINGLYSPSLNLYVPCLFHSISMQVMYHGRHVLYFCALAREQNELSRA